MKKQFIAKLLVLALVLFMVPATILAASAATAGNNSGYYDVYEDTTVRVNEPVPETGADLTIKSSVATIIIPNEVLTNEFANFGSVKVSAQATGSSVGFSIQASGKALKNIKGLKVEF